MLRTYHDYHISASLISEQSRYIHQGWVTDTENQEYLLIDDEYDEWDHTTFTSDGHAITYIIDIRDLENPTLSGHYKSAVRGIDHTQYTKNGLVYQSNYGTGLRVLDITSIPADPTGGGVKEIGFFDIYPEDDDLEDGGVVDFLGTWSSYGLFASGHVVINTIERGGELFSWIWPCTKLTKSKLLWLNIPVVNFGKCMLQTQ